MVRVNHMDDDYEIAQKNKVATHILKFTRVYNKYFFLAIIFFLVFAVCLILVILTFTTDLNINKPVIIACTVISFIAFLAFRIIYSHKLKNTLLDRSIVLDDKYDNLTSEEISLITNVEDINSLHERPSNNANDLQNSILSYRKKLQNISNDKKTGRSNIKMRSLVTLLRLGLNGKADHRDGTSPGLYGTFADISTLYGDF